MVWEPESCCGSASLRTGTQILGCWGMISALISVLVLIGLSIIDQDVFLTAFYPRPFRDYNQSAYDTYSNITAGAILFTACVLLSYVGVCAALLKGVAKNKPEMMLPYLIVQVIGIVIVGFGALCLSIFILFYGGSETFILLVVLVLVTSMQVYFFLVVRSCYLEVKQSCAGVSGSDTSITYEQQKNEA